MNTEETCTLPLAGIVTVLLLATKQVLPVILTSTVTDSSFGFMIVAITGISSFVLAFVVNTPILAVSIATFFLKVYTAFPSHSFKPEFSTLTKYSLLPS